MSSIAMLAIKKSDEWRLGIGEGQKASERGKKPEDRFRE